MTPHDLLQPGRFTARQTVIISAAIAAWPGRVSSAAIFAAIDAAEPGVSFHAKRNSIVSARQRLVSFGWTLRGKRKVSDASGGSGYRLMTLAEFRGETA